MTSRRKPDIEAVSVKVKADEVRDEGYFHARNTHGGNRMTASGRVKITVTKQHKDSGDTDRRPSPGTVFSGPDDKEPVEIEARGVRVIKKKDADGKETGIASGRVEIFGKLRRLKR